MWGKTVTSTYEIFSFGATFSYALPLASESCNSGYESFAVIRGKLKRTMVNPPIKKKEADTEL